MQNKKLYVRYIQEVDDIKKYQMILEYYLVEKKIGENYCELKSYGIQVKKISKFSDGSTSEDIKLIHDIFFDKNEAENFIHLLADNAVTPATFKDIIDDFIGRTIHIRPAKSNISA